jgi:PAS domain S-box-containing protein
MAGRLATLQRDELPSGLVGRGITSLVQVDVRTTRQELGVLLVGKEGPWELGSRDHFVLSTLANETVLALENVRLRREATEQAQTLRALIQASPLGIIARDGDGQVQMWNPAAERIFGWSEQEVLGRPYPLVPEEKLEEFRMNLERSLRGEALTGQETLRQRKDGAQVDVGIWTGPLSDGGAMVVIADISERKRAEEALRESEERYRSLYGNTPVMMHSIDREGRLASVNNYWLEVMGYERSEVVGRRSTDFLTEASRRYATEVTLPEFFKTGVARDVEYQMVKKNEEVIDVLLSAIAERDKAGEIIHTLAFAVDVTERKRSEEALRESEERFRKIFDNSNDAIMLIDPEQDKILDFNPKACDMLGFSPQELSSLSISDIHPGEMPELLAFAQSVLETGQGWTNELTCRTKTGAVLQAEISSSTVEIGGRTRMISLVRDTTERKRAEEALRESEEQVRLLLNSTGEAIYGVDLQGNCTFCNPACLRLLGYAECDLLGQNMHNLIHHTLPNGNPYPVEECRIYQALRGGQGTHVDDEVLWRADKTNFPAEYWSSPVLRENKLVGCVVTFVDITERQQAQETLLQQMRELAVLEERNRMAREIHDSLAQGLTAIIWQLNAAEKAVERGGEQALQSLNRVRNLARDGLQEARRSVWDLRAGPLEGRTLSEALEQEVKSAAGAGDVETSFVVSGIERVLPAGVEAVLLRICQEALTNVLKYAKATRMTATLAFDQSQVRLAVRDDGIGFDPELPIRRDRDSGGFGLINMRERARLLGGELTVQSELGKGTLVEVALSLE